MISGALLLDPAKKENLMTFYKKRLARILIPIAFWSLFFLGWTVLQSSLQGEVITTLDLIKKLLSGKPYFHMWFLYMILGLYLFTPFFRKIVAGTTKPELVVLVVITFVMSALNYAYEELFSGESKFFINWFFLYVPFFFLGHLIREDKRHYPRLLPCSVFILSVLLTFFGCYIVGSKSGLSAGLYFYGYLSISVIPMSIGMMYLLKTLENPIFSDSFTKKTSTLILGVYLIHPIVLEAINYTRYGTTAFHPILSIPIIASIVFLLSLAGAKAIDLVPYLRRVI
jgi:surface polysaccharide O-acyltransferase-like enzyme